MGSHNVSTIGRGGGQDDGRDGNLMQASLRKKPNPLVPESLFAELDSESCRVSAHLDRIQADRGERGHASRARESPIEHYAVAQQEHTKEQGDGSQTLDARK